MATIGKFTEGAARLHEHGQVLYDGNGSEKSVTDVYLVLMANATTRATTANVTGLPAIDSAHGTYSKLYCTGYRFSQEATDSRFWRIEVTFEKVLHSSASQGETELIRAMEWSTTTHQTDLVSDQVTGLAVQNSAGDLFDSVPQTDVTDIVVHIVRLEKSLNLNKLALAGTTNNNAITICGVLFPKHCGLVQVTIRDTLDNDSNSKYRYEYDYTLTRRRNFVKINNAVTDIGWDLAVLDCGFNILDGGETKKILIEDADGQKTEPSLPQRLDGSGALLEPSSPSYFFRFSALPEGNWSTLGLPTNKP